MKFEEIGYENKDHNGIVLMSILFDIAVNDIYGEIELSDFVACEYDGTSWMFSCVSKDGPELRLYVNNDFSIDFWSDQFPLHFNQSKIYAKLLEYSVWNPLNKEK